MPHELIKDYELIGQKSNGIRVYVLLNSDMMVHVNSINPLYVQYAK